MRDGGKPLGQGSAPGRGPKTSAEQSEGTSSAAAEMALRRSYQRYAYLSPAKPAPGDRREAEWAFREGLQAQRSRRLTSAIAAYERAVQLDPAYFSAYYNLGLAAYDAEELAKALAALETALAIDSGSVNARYNFALALEKADYPVDAARELETLLATHPGEVRAHLVLANLYAQELGQPQRARDHYQKVLRLEPNHPQAPGITSWLSAHR
jgi:tetratricopeptide (TPR) repeat protein